MDKIRLDFETYSEQDISKVGAYRYTCGDEARVLCMAYQINNDPVECWVPEFGEEPPEFMRGGKLDTGFIYSSFNAFFERSVFRNILNIDPLTPDKWRDPQARLAYCALPLNLAQGGAHAGVPPEMLKSPYGKYLIKILCCPDPKTGKPFDFNEFAGALNALKPPAVEEKIRSFLSKGGVPEDGISLALSSIEYGYGHLPGVLRKLLMTELIRYCKQDVTAEGALDKILPPLPESEQRVWEADMAINERGVHVDIPTIKKVIAINAEAHERSLAEARRISGDDSFNPNSPTALLEWAETQGVQLLNAQKKYLESMIPKVPEHVADMLKVRLSISKNSLSKYDTLLAAHVDGVVRGNLQYHGATTGRWAGRLAQFQNIPRPLIFSQDKDYSAVEEAIDAIQIGSYDLLCTLYGADNVTDVLVSCTRGMIIAPPGKKLVVCDYSQIESRGLAWEAGQTNKVEAFRKGVDLYKFAAMAIYGKAAESEVTKSERDIGKVSELACGYNGALGAFQQMAKTYGVIVEDTLAEQIVRMWRTANPFITAYWKNVEDAAINAIRCPGIASRAVSGRVKFRLVKTDSGLEFLRCILPSGRSLQYPKPSIIQREIKYEKVNPDTGKQEVHSFTKDAVEFFGYDTSSQQWTRVCTYGGKLTENIIQAMCSDFLRSPLVALENPNNGLMTVLHVHDEIVCEADEHDNNALENLRATMCEVPTWAEGMPIAAAGYESKRYKKE